MTDITELAQSLKAAAEKAGANYWQAKKISGDFYVIRKGSYKLEYGYRTYQPIAEIYDKPTRDYVAIASPANVLALIESLEKAQQRIAELESRAVKLIDCDFGAVQHMSGGSTDYCNGFVDGTQNAIRSISAAGINVEAE